MEGYNVVKACEACGSRSGETEFDVMIADCGQLNGGGDYMCDSEAAASLEGCNLFS